MTKKSNKTALARAAMTAIEPVVELLLEIGITSPEAESLFRSLFVHKARAWLMERDPDKASPTDIRLSLVTGVHRNFVRRILAEPPKIAAAREMKGHRISRLLQAWHSDPRYLDSSGRPRDLPEKGPAPSFQTLASKRLPGMSRSLIIQELQRSGLIQRLPEGRLRVRARNLYPGGISVRSLDEIGRRARSYFNTLMHNARNPGNRRIFEETAQYELDASRIGFMRELMRRRTLTFLMALEQEFAIEGARTKRRRGQGQTVRFGFAALETQPEDPA